MAKLICVNTPETRERVVGFHFIGPNAGEVTQGFALALKLGATKADFDDNVGERGLVVFNYLIIGFNYFSVVIFRLLIS